MVGESPLLADKHAKEKEGTALREKDHLFFRRDFLYGGLAFVGLIAVITAGYIIKSKVDGKGFPFTYWLILLVVLWAMVQASPDKFKKYARSAVIAAMVIPLILWSSPFLDSSEKAFDCFINGLNCPATLPAERPRGSDRVKVGNSGSIVAPRSYLTKWHDFPRADLCHRVWTDHRNKRDIVLEYQDKDGNEFRKMGDGKYLHIRDKRGNELFQDVQGPLDGIVAFRTKSLMDGPVTVYFDTWPKSNGKCVKL